MRNKTKEFNKFKRGARALSIYSENLGGHVKVKFSSDNILLKFSEGKIKNTVLQGYIANEILYKLGRFCENGK